MKKRILSILVLVMLLVMLIPNVANAAGNGVAVPVAGKVQPYSDEQFAQLEKMVNKANMKIENAVKNAQNTPFDDVAGLLAYVDGIVADVMAYANSIGAIVVCEYTLYNIDGQNVMIDPLRIIPL
ncbi:MAG: hypothetical protein LLF75_02900 [Eubacteriales bacterium]|nr:hypothetical protein [Eubacteriales bacterium]